MRRFPTAVQHWLHRAVWAAGVFLLAPPPSSAQDTPCERCERVAQLVEEGQAREAWRIAVDLAEGADAMTTTRLAYLTVMGSPDDPEVVAFARAVLEGVLAGSWPPLQEALLAYLLLRWAEHGVPPSLFPQAAALAATLVGQRVVEPPEVDPALHAEILAIRASELGTRIDDESYGATWRPPPANYERCDRADIAQCWIEMRRSRQVFYRPERAVRSDALEARRRRLMELSFDHDPTSGPVVRAFLGDLAKKGQWGEFAELASLYATAVDSSGWSLAYLGTVAWRVGMPELADSLFNQALEALPTAERRRLLDVSQSVLPRHEDRYLTGDPEIAESWSRFLLQVSDPLFLTPKNERRLEHFSRVVLSQLWFENQTLGTSGVETDPGEIQIRYGAPARIFEVSPREPVESGPDPLSDFGRIDRAELGETTEAIFWSFGPQRPTFLFLREIGSGELRHHPKSLQEARDLREVEPSTGSFPVVCLSHQVARFKGGQPGIVDVDFYAEIPGDTTSLEPLEVESGLFFLPGALGQDRIDLRTHTVQGYLHQNLTYRAPLAPGDYTYQIEVVTDDLALRMAQRRSLEVLDIPSDRLATSDLLLAHSVRQRVDEPHVREHFEIDPAIDRRFTAGGPIGLYFEVYPSPLETSGRYRVRLQVRDANRGSFFGRALRSVGTLFGSEDETGALAWESHYEAHGGRVPEWLTVEADLGEPGIYELVVEITPEQGEPVELRRRFRLVEPRSDGLAYRPKCDPALG